jgi:hypothetical protein
MGGPRIDSTAVRKVISSQPRTFTMEDIAREAKISTASAYAIISQLKGEGSITVDHKIGKKLVYAVSANGSKDGAIKPNIVHLTPAQRFEYVGTLVDMVAQGISPSVLVTGLSGIGKTFLVRERLKANGLHENDGYITVMGHSSPLGLYRVLYEHQRQTIVFDDCDSVFRDETSVNLLKSALDSYDVRKVSWQSSRLPDELEASFNFSGQIIFVSNLTADRVDEAIKSRTFVIDLQMSRKEICEYLWTLIDTIEPSMHKVDKEEILTELDKRCDSFEQFNIRTFIKACRVFKVAKSNGKDWKEMITVLI